MDESLHYAVVYFKRDRTYSEVPSSWISPSKTSCWWPSSKNVSTLITRGVDPDPTSSMWEEYDIEIIGFYATLDAARKKATDSDYTSGEEPKGRGLRRKKKSCKIISEGEYDTETSDSSKENTPPPSITKTTKTLAKSLIQREENDNPIYLSQSDEYENSGHTYSISLIRDNTPTSSITKKKSKYQQRQEGNTTLVLTPGHVSEGDNSDGLECTPSVTRIHSSTPIAAVRSETSNNKSLEFEIIQEPSTIKEQNDRTIIANPKFDQPRDQQLENLAEKVEYLTKITKKILIYVKGIEDRLQETQMADINIEKNIEEIMEMIPLHSQEDLLHLEGILKNDNGLKERFINYMKTIGGRTPKEMVSRIMGKLITNSLGIKCSLHGKRNHFAFKNVIFLTMIITAVRHVFATVCESEIELTIGEWLRLSKLRQSREKPKE